MISVPWGAVVIGILFIVGATLLQRGALTAGTTLVGVLRLFILASTTALQRGDAVDWASQVGFGVRALDGLITATGLFVIRRGLARNLSPESCSRPNGLLVQVAGEPVPSALVEIANSRLQAGLVPVENERVLQMRRVRPRETGASLLVGRYDCVRRATSAS